MSWTVSDSGGGACNGAASCTITVILNLVDRTDSTMVTLGGTFTGCSYSLGHVTWPYAVAPDTCNFLSDWSTGQGGTFTFPAVGSAYTDANFGGTVRILTPSPRSLPNSMDAIVGAANADGTYVATQDVSNNTQYITSATGSGDVFSGVIRVDGWHWSDPNTYYSFGIGSVAPLSVTKVTASTQVTVAAYAYMPTGGATGLSGSGDSPISSDGWLALTTQGGTDSKLVLLNLNTQPATAYTVVLPQANVRWSQVLGGCDSVTNKRYIALSYSTSGVPNPGTDHGNDVYAWDCNTHVLAFDFKMPARAGAASFHFAMQGPTCTSAADNTFVLACEETGHSTVAMVNGQAYYVPYFQTGAPFMAYFVYQRINAGLLMGLPVEAGGGMTVGPPLTNSGLYDSHNSCADVGVCAIEFDGDPILDNDSLFTSTLYSSPLLGCTNANPVSCHYANSNLNSLLANGQFIAIGGIQGACAAGLNAHAWTVAALNTGAQTFNLAGSTMQGLCTANTGGIVSNVHPPQPPVQTGVFLIDARTIASKYFVVTRLPNNRSFRMQGNISNIGYYQQVLGSISRRGTLWVGSSGTLPDTVQVVGIPTGFVPQIFSTQLPGGTTLSGGVSIR